MKIAVAMSGGVDSSVAAAILIKEGYDVFGVTMRHYNSVEYGFDESEGIEAAILDAEKVCIRLNITHHIIDVSEDFKKIIEKNFIHEYSIGRTPNPCTLCNPAIKWGSLLKKVEKLDAEKIATGHYIEKRFENGIYNLYKASDESKDQSYMLWRLDQNQLSKTLFPITKLSKQNVRKIANEMKLPVHGKEESQEICFIKGHYEEYLKNHISLNRGDITLPDGKIIGTHRGLPLYTIGQRKGLNTPWSSPLYVLKLDIVNNRLIVTDNPDELFSIDFRIQNINWISGKIPENLSNLSVQIRYNSKPEPVEKLQFKDNEITIQLLKPARAITPGQSAVFYKGNLLLGGGIIM